MGILKYVQGYEMGIFFKFIIFGYVFWLKYIDFENI